MDRGKRNEGHDRELNEAIRFRIRGLLRERKIKNSVCADALGISEHSLHSKLYRNIYPFTLAQIVNLQRYVLIDVDMQWLLTGESAESRNSVYRVEFENYELGQLNKELKAINE